MRILLTGKTGQIGYELNRTLQGMAEIIAVGREQMDLTDLRQVRDVICAVKPTLIINAAAYTEVDRAESEPQLAMRINAEAPYVMAQEAKRIGAGIIHLSTDYVFDGAKQGAYLERDATNPLSVYGATKRAGEEGVQAAGAPFLIMRTSWLYSLRGKNFFTIIRRLAMEGNDLRVVNDQHGAPTWTHIVTSAIMDIVKQTIVAKDALEWLESRAGLYHLAAKGNTTWYGFAEAIVQQLSLAKMPVIMPIDSCQYHSVAERPKNSILDCGRWIDIFGDLPTWDEALRQCMFGRPIACDVA